MLLSADHTQPTTPAGTEDLVGMEGLVGTEGLETPRPRAPAARGGGWFAGAGAARLERLGAEAGRDGHRLEFLEPLE